VGTEQGKKWAEFPTDVNEESNTSTSDQRTAISAMKESLISHVNSESGFPLVYSA